MRKFMAENGLHLSWAIALVAMLGSLYFSEIKGFLPCKLCWYQRILMYPQVFLLGIASVRKQTSIYLYVLPMTLLGACISIYHYLMEKTDLFPSNSFSCGIVPCDLEYINWFGFVTIPFLALTAFILISAIHLVLWRIDKSEQGK
ncbi:disulfide bond formation protein B [Paenibacillus hemerocallicola]|uniref:Disulfide bond formation protein B n=1 Tax=Paenibacillus hemerocallicola TaxID=1172614 RepID=A0A5C4SYW3_9BACL|nr:disulfide oxidoreductase [Paenibacillus hemerocallicola]TNJ61866.1 disulfide bond formation protein B [Paenibacillus hemerocallicola]